MKIDLAALRKIAKATPNLVVSELVSVLAAVIEIERDQTERERISNKRQHDATTANNEQQTPTAPKTQTERENELYRMGEAILGRNSKGMIAAQLKAHHYDTAAVAAELLNAKMKGDPRGYFATICRRTANGNGKGGSVMAAFDDLIDQAGGGEVGGDPPMRDITPGCT